jgi:hypothetical protein
LQDHTPGITSWSVKCTPTIKLNIQKLQSRSTTTYNIIMTNNSLYIVSAHILPLELGQWSLGVVTRLRGWTGRVRIPAQARDFLFSKTVQTGSGPHPASYSMGTRVLSQGSGSQGIKWTIHLQLVPRLRMSQAITLLSLCAIMLWKGMLSFFFSSHNCPYTICPPT